MDPKETLRHEILSRRHRLSSAEVTEAGKKVAARLYSLDIYNLAERFALYANAKNEVPTEAIFIRAHADRKEIYYPACDPKTFDLQFYRVNALKDLSTGFCNILEPKLKKHPLRNIDYLDFVVIPGVAFDARGNRLGFGKGCYDRWLKNYHGKRIAFAYEFQLVDEVPADTNDEKVELIVTEERVITVA